MTTTKRKLTDEEELAEYEQNRDCVVELGMALKREIPKGDEFLDWIADEDTEKVCVTALVERGFTWNEIQLTFFNLSRDRWLPPIEQLQRAAR